MVLWGLRSEVIETMARTAITPQERPAPYDANGVAVSWTALNDDGDGYEATFRGPLDILVWNDGTTGTATFTVTSVAAASLGNRTGDYSITAAAGGMYRFTVPQVGFDNSGKAYFQVTGTGADDVKVAVFYTQ